MLNCLAYSQESSWVESAFQKAHQTKSTHRSPNKSGPVGRRKEVTDAEEVTKIPTTNGKDPGL